MKAMRTSAGLEGHIESVGHQIIGAALEVHKALGPGYLESVYEQALAYEFQLRKMRFERQLSIPVIYKAKDVGEGRLQRIRPAGRDSVLNAATILDVRIDRELVELRARRREAVRLIAILRERVSRIDRTIAVLDSE